MNIAKNLEDAALHFPNRSAVLENERDVNYMKLNHDASCIASALVATGLKPGDYVALCAPNSYAWLVVYFGVLKAGAVAVTFSHILTKTELLQILSDCQPKVLFTDDKKLEELDDLKNLPFIELVVCDHGNISFDRLLEKGSPDFIAVDMDRHDIAAILYTGGTTGTPKGAMLSHANLQSSIFNVAHYERTTERDRALCFLPLNHVFAQVHIMNSMIFCGGGLVMQPGFNLDRVLDAIRRWKVTKFYAVPTIYIRLLELDDLKERFKRVTYCFSAAASMASEVVREWKSRTGLDIYEAYGMTESASMVTYNHYYRHVVGSVGTPVNLVEVKICDFDGNILEPDHQGEICIRGPNITIGYLNNPEETRCAFRDDWFRSGDIGMVDGDGYLFIVDRLKDMVITGGENVYPREVEELLYTRPEVRECAVVGLPDREYGERVTAFIVATPGHQPDPKELKSFLKERLAGYKVPKEFITVAELPKSNSGKLLKRVIKEGYTA